MLILQVFIEVKGRCGVSEAEVSNIPYIMGLMNASLCPLIGEDRKDTAHASWHKQHFLFKRVTVIVHLYYAWN